MRLPVNRVLPLATLILLGTAGAAIGKGRPETPVQPVTGPAADYPVVVGKPFTIGDTVWTPTDQLNYDAVGYAGVGDAGLAGVTGAHKTLPLPCYVEVTALDTGRTILVRLERRGPMVNDVLVELSPMAATQLGLAPGSHSPVRVRRVNPPEQERAMLRVGGRAPERMETPQGLLRVLRRKLAEQSPLMPPPSKPPEMPTMLPAAAKPAPKPAFIPAEPKPALPARAATPAAPETPKPAPAAKPAQKGSLVVQVAAFSVEANARKVARQLGGDVSRAGKFWRVRLGPFTNRAQAGPALEKARHAGYSDARIQSAD
ncbi:SPOR domain-containing protein [Novosphingobium mangrovi (ex Huang et al. 2023)]|uniref:SPOR domain-containing protein n=1 Tax=Novosphingobium mangrovi (ex Huang et al. 2023) TaxID=2976432 RepID=A0ABT2I7J7_9SPHN|nr:SPOR domain-containing protein [Novosphingobium mangrovi (ex Huang et al. 2023)]MCT2400790.1 SPOR domain-containing protein [Novosphingobium mangrovi (ex Huang et al. 2023)]